MKFDKTISQSFFQQKSLFTAHLEPVVKHILEHEVYSEYAGLLNKKQYTLFAINDSYRKVLFFIDYGQGFPTDTDIQIGRCLAEKCIQEMGEEAFNFFKENYCSLHYRKKVFSGTFF